MPPVTQSWHQGICQFQVMFFRTSVWLNNMHTPQLQWGNHMFSSVSQKSWPLGSLARYVKLRVVHVPMPGTFSPPPWVSDPNMHHSTCMTHVPWCMPASLTSGLLWSRWREKRSQHSRCMRNTRFYVSGKRPMEREHYSWVVLCLIGIHGSLPSLLFGNNGKTLHVYIHVS